jgi:hypothetical protein
VNCRTHVAEKRAAVDRVDFLIAQLNNVVTLERACVFILHETLLLKIGAK